MTKTNAIAQAEHRVTEELAELLIDALKEFRESNVDLPLTEEGRDSLVGAAVAVALAATFSNYSPAELKQLLSRTRQATLSAHRMVVKEERRIASEQHATR